MPSKAKKTTSSLRESDGGLVRLTSPGCSGRSQVGWEKELDDFVIKSKFMLSAEAMLRYQEEHAGKEGVNGHDESSNGGEGDRKKEGNKAKDKGRSSKKQKTSHKEGRRSASPERATENVVPSTSGFFMSWIPTDLTELPRLGDFHNQERSNQSLGNTQQALKEDAQEDEGLIRPITADTAEPVRRGFRTNHRCYNAEYPVYILPYIEKSKAAIK